MDPWAQQQQAYGYPQTGYPQQPPGGFAMAPAMVPPTTAGYGYPPVDYSQMQQPAMAMPPAQPVGYPMQPQMGYPTQPQMGYPPQGMPQQPAYPQAQGYGQPQMGYPPQGMPAAPMGYGGAYPYGAPAGGAPGYGGAVAFTPSACTGRKKSLLIGINYMRSQRPLRGCINDVNNIRKFLMERYNFPTDTMVVLTDDQNDSSRRPTKANMLRYMKWLVEGASPGDSLFLHFSGHGGQVRDTSGDEDDGWDETILPEDYATAGQIIDDDLYKILVKPLPPGARLTVIFDSCHSGTAMDLPYVYNERGCIEAPGMGGSSGKKGKKGKKMKKMKKVKEGKKGKKDGGYGGAAAQGLPLRQNTSLADVIMFSGCRDDQTSADTSFAGFGQTGAMSYSFITALTRKPKLSYQELLATMRQTLNSGERRFTQIPQLSTGRPMDMSQTFIM